MLLHKRVNVDLLCLLISYLKLVEELLQRILTLVANLSEVQNQVTEVEGCLVDFPLFIPSEVMFCPLTLLPNHVCE